MGEYLKAAFWISPQVPGLGRLPVNALALAGFSILGLGHPGFWLLGLGAEAAWLFAASQSARFRQLIDARNELLGGDSIAQQRAALIARLAPESRARLARLDAGCARALQLQQEAGVSDVTLDLNRDALGKLTWAHLKLLVARETLLALGDDSTRRQLQQRVAALERELDGPVTETLRESKEATLRILQQRLAHVDRRDQSLEEIGSDLTRIEAQVDLAVDSAGLRGKDAAISADIHFVSQFLDDSVFGEASASIAALDQTYGARKVAE